MIYRKGEEQSGLATAGAMQRVDRETERRNIGDQAQDTRDYERGITTARHIVSLGNSTPLNELSLKELGPVSGSELAKAKQKKIDAKKKR